jgi:cation diffusion facilitator CzcD-associated flavoprotein CzcO
MTDTAEQAVETHVEEIAAGWISAFSRALQAGDAESVSGMFLTDGYWRDLLALTWDLRTLKGPDSVERMLAEHLGAAGLRDVALAAGKPIELVEPDPATSWIEAFITFETTAAHGRGVLRLMQDADGEWRAWTLLTAVENLRGHEMASGPRRATGKDRTQAPRENWADVRERELDFRDSEPQVVIVGAGQGGLSAAASLGLLGVDTLIVEKNQRVGDNWRKRYRSLVLHDPVWADHLPYLPFPDSWPIYTPKDKLADWFESYASAMELNVWTDTELLESSYDDDSRRWTVRVRRADGSERALHPAHVILATGALGEPNVPAFEGIEDFQGTVVHSSGHTGGEGWRGKNAVVIGACNSGHDIAQDFYEQGAEVTLVQRSSTYVMSQRNGIPVLFGSLYYEGGPDTEDADLLNAAYPLPLVIEFAKAQTAAIAEMDEPLLAGLASAGFKLDMGDDGGGLMAKALRRGGGYYIDVGCSGLIADGKIKVRQGSGIERFTETGITFQDGSTLDADVIVLATGFSNMRETARRLFGDELAGRVTPVWDLDEEGEINTLWRNSGHPGFWFMGGPLVMARIYSRYLALQIKAIEEGLLTHPATGERSGQ